MRGLIAPLIKLVAFLVITLFFTYVLAATISNQSFGAAASYKAYFTDVTGLNEGDDVRVAGVRVGTVDSISIVRRSGDTSIAVVGFTVQKSRPLPTSVTAALRYRNLVGQRYIDIEPTAGGSTQALKSGAIIPLSQTRPAVDLTVLFEGFKPLVQGLDPGQVNQLSFELIQTLQGEGGALQLLLSNLADLTNSLADKDQVIGQVVDNLTSTLDRGQPARQRAVEPDHPAADLHLRPGQGPHDDRQRHRRHQQPGDLDRGPADADPAAR